MDADIVLSEDQVSEYRRNGAICLRKVFSPHWIAQVTRGIDANLAAPSAYSERLCGAGGSGLYFNDYCNWRHIPQIRDFVYNSPAARIVSQLMGSKESIFYHDHVLIKEAHTDRVTPWHQDQAYYPIDGDQVCSMWLPVDPVTTDTCVQFVSGSHAWGRWFYPRKFHSLLNYPIDNPAGVAGGGGKTFEDIPGEDIDRCNAGLSDRYEILKWDVNVGDCIVFHMKTIHGAPSNNKPSSRRVLATRWLGDDAVFAERAWKVSPPITAGLTPGQPVRHEEIFPVIYTRRV